MKRRRLIYICKYKTDQLIGKQYYLSVKYTNINYNYTAILVIMWSQIKTPIKLKILFRYESLFVLANFGQACPKHNCCKW